MVDATELVDDFRRPNDIDSRFLRGIVVPFVADTCRGTREDEVCGEARTELRAVLDAETCPFSKTPNSFINSLPPAGEPLEDARPLDDPTIMLARRPFPFAFSVGEFAADDRLEIRGIFVGVSLDSTEEVFSAESGGPSFPSRTTGWRPPTEGDPAMVGSWCRRREESECFCIELTVCEVTRDEAPALTEPALEVRLDCEEDFKLATR